MRKPGGRAEEDLVRMVALARRDPALAVLEGFHTLKHALRFGARPVRIVSTDPEQTVGLATEISPDITALLAEIESVSEAVFRRLSPIHIPTGVLAIAERPVQRIEDALSGSGPVVLLEDPMDLSNVGAVVRVAAAAGSAGVFVLGRKDPWAAEALRSSAGLHYALPVVRADKLPETSRPLIAVDPGSEELGPGQPIPPAAILAFGTERGGLSPSLLERAERRVRIPMREGVSSLNLATSVAAVLYAGVLRR
jgi:RNA methyltransferase, TrmH family